MPPLTPKVEADYGPWPPVEICRRDGHNWGGQPAPGPYPIMPFPEEGEYQSCPVCGCGRATDDGRLHYYAPRGTL